MCLLSKVINRGQCCLCYNVFWNHGAFWNCTLGCFEVAVGHISDLHGFYHWQFETDFSLGMRIFCLLYRERGV